MGMKFYALVSTVYNHSQNEGWVDHDLVVDAINQQDARRMIRNWAKRKPRLASQIIIDFVTKEQFDNDCLADIQEL